MTPATTGKLSAKDERVAHLLKWTPWLPFFSMPLLLPIPFLLLYLSASATDSAAVLLLLSVASLGVGLLVGALLAVLLLLYRKRWHERLRDRLAADGITAAEVPWFTSELTANEREVLAEIQKTNPLLADAYSETLASRLTATRLIARTKADLLSVDRRINRAHSLEGADTSSLLRDLNHDRDQLEKLISEITGRLAEAKTRLQVIESVANRTLGQAETDLMLRRLSAAQEHLPLGMEMATLERQTLQQANLDSPNTTVEDPH